MSVELPKIYEQALVSVLAAAQEKGLNVGELYERACELSEAEDSKVRFLDTRDSGDVAMVISLATAKLAGF